MKIFLATILALALCAPTFAKPHPWHYVKTHKLLLAEDALIAAAWTLDASSSLQCQRQNPGCVEENGILSHHPGANETIAYAAGIGAAQISLNHVIWHQGEPYHPLTAFFTAPFLIVEGMNISHNYCSAHGVC